MSQQLCLLPITVPDFFYAAARITAPYRYLAIYYQSSKAVWTTGNSAATFSYYALYKPLTEHCIVALMLDIAGAFGGSDDDDATHSLLIDRMSNQIYLGKYDIVHQLLKKDQEKLDIEISLSSPETATREGMFELFSGGLFGGGYSLQQQQETQNLIAHLDSYVSPEIFQLFEEQTSQSLSFKTYYLIEAFKQFINRQRYRK